MKHHLLIALIIGVFVSLASSTQTTSSKSPAWQVGEHPRLITTAAEKPALVAKLNQPNTVSAALWTSFLAANNATYTEPDLNNNGDSGALYYISGDATDGANAHDYVMNYLAIRPVITPNGSGFDIRWWEYRNFMTTFDFAYDRLSATERQQVLAYIARQGAACANADPSWAPGNINATWASCLLGSAVLLEGENYSINVVDEAVTHATLNGRDTLLYPHNLNITKIATTPGGAAAYTKPADYTTFSNAVFDDRAVDWAPAGAEPAIGATYYVSYTFTPDTGLWLTLARKFMDHHFNYEWHDGYYNGGFFYAAVDLEEIPFLIEVSRRNLGIDYRDNNDLKRAIDMYIYERLPANDDREYRYNMINDASSWTERGVWQYYGWLRRFVVWATSAYAGDDEGYDQRYRWFWTKAYRTAQGNLPNPIGADWREAWWVGDSVLGSYPVTTVPTVTWPAYRYLRGHEVVYAHTQGPWPTDQNAVALSFVAGPHNYLNEHDQGDSGSFTFHAQGEDWAVDPGYGNGGQTNAGWTSKDHNTVGIDGAGYNPTGLTYGDEQSTPIFGGSTTIDQVALSASASAVSANLAPAWSIQSTSPVERQQRYIALISDSLPAYTVIADDVKKDASTHSYQWYLHTAPGNTAVNQGDKQYVTGKHGSGSSVALVQTLNPVGTSTAWTTTNVSNMGAHPLMTETAASTVNPYFLHVILPGTPGSGSPTPLTRVPITNGTAATLIGLNSAVDTILWRHGAGSVTYDGLTSDARLTIVRRVGGQVAGFVAIEGRAVTNNGEELLTVYDGSAPVTVTAFGGTAAVDGTDASRIRLGLPTITTAHIQDSAQSIGLTNDGTAVYINAREPYRRTRAGAPALRTENFARSATNDFLLYNMDYNPGEDFAATGGVFPLRPTTNDWFGLVKRDSTFRRRSWLYPTVIPPVEHDDADISFRFRFTTLAANRSLRAYFRVTDKQWGYSWPGLADWSTNQNYIRLELQPAASQVTLGERVNGAWSSNLDNNTLTQAATTAPWSANDTAWHQARVRLQGQSITVTIDGTAVAATTVTANAPTAGYLQWQSSGTTVELDDIVHQTIDVSAPPPPTGGVITIVGDDRAIITYGQGTSSDVERVDIFTSPTPITADQDPATLERIGTTVGAASTVALTSVNPSQYFAATVFDIAGNHSQFAQLELDTTPPAIVNNLRAL